MSPFEGKRSRKRRKGKKKLPGYFIGGLFENQPSQQSSSQNSTFNTNFSQENNLDPAYWNKAQNYLERASTLADTPFARYPTDERFAPLTKDQQLGFWNTRESLGSWKPDMMAARDTYGQAGDVFGGAGEAFDTAAGVNPLAMSQPFIDRAAATQTGSQAASPYMSMGAESWPEAMKRYMSPYTGAVVENIGKLGARNLSENLLPQINSVFTGAQFGRKGHADFTARALRDQNESTLREQTAALERGYGTSANIFGSDAGRAAGLAGTAGTLAQGDLTGATNLAATQARIAGDTKAGDIALGTARTSLGTATAGLGDRQAALGAGIQNANRLDNADIMASGDKGWAYEQQKRDFDAQQFERMYNTEPQARSAAYGQALRGLPIPTSSSGQTSGTSSSAGSQSTTGGGGSIFGQLAGVGLAAASLASSDSRDKTDKKHLGVDPQTGLDMWSYRYKDDPKSYPKVVGPMAQDVEERNPFAVREIGGHKVIEYAVGGMVPTVSAMRRRVMQRHPPPQQPGMMPTGMPGMPPLPALAPRGPQPNGQMGSTPFARGGAVDVVKGVHQHERAMHEGEPLTRLHFAQGGYTGNNCFGIPRGGHGEITTKIHFADGGPVPPPDPNAELEAFWSNLLGHPSDRNGQPTESPMSPMMGYMGDLFGSANAGTGSGGDSVGGVSGGTGGIGGAAGTGGSAAAGIGGDDGGTYADGGQYDDRSFTLTPEERRMLRQIRLNQSGDRIQSINDEASANPFGYWGETLTNVPRGAASILSLAGAPGSMGEIFGPTIGGRAMGSFGRSGSLPTMEGVDHLLDRVVPEPTTYGGRAGRQTGEALLALLGIGGVDRLARAMQGGRRAFDTVGNAANLGFSFPFGAE